MIDKVQDFLKPAPTRHAIDRPTPEWAAEQILLTFQQFQINITPARIISTIVEKWRSLKHEFSPPKINEIILCNINSIDYYSNSPKPVLNLSLNNSKQEFGLWLHQSIFQFLNSPILSPSRKIRFLASQILNDYYMLPVRCIIFELNDGSLTDLNWAKPNVQKSTLVSLKQSPRSVNAIMVKIVTKTKSSFFVKDDTISNPIELILKSQELDYLKLLDESDIIIVWKPEIYQNPFCVELTSESVIFRAPVPSAGENQREIMKCGIVDSIGHFIESGEWKGCQIDIILKGGLRNSILFSSQTNYYHKKIISSFQAGHFAYFFHLVAYSDGTFRFSTESTVYNLNVFSSFLDSMIVCPVPIARLADYTSGVVRAVILKIEIESAIVHIDCGCRVDEKRFCPRCLASASGRTKKAVLTKLAVDDGSGMLTVYGYSTNFNLVGYEIEEWETLDEKTKSDAIARFVGCEFVFFLTRCNAVLFSSGVNEAKGAFVWRIDTFSEGKEETKRVVRTLIDLLNDNDAPYYKVGFCGDSPFFTRNESAKKP